MIGNNMQTILITGINGFLGSNLAKKLSQNFKIIGLEQNKNNLFRLEEADFKIYSIAENSLESIFNENNIDFIIHAATLYGHDNELSSNIIQTNILLPVRLIEIAKLHKIKAFLNVDSFFNNPVYKYNYLGEYSLSKKNCLEWLIQMKSDLKVVNLKIFHLYGPGDNKNKFVPWIIEQLQQSKPFINLTPGKQLRDFIYVDDVISAFQTVLLNINFIENKFTSIDIGSGNSVSIEEFVKTAKKIINSPSELIFGAIPYRDGEIMVSKAEIGFLKKCNWTAKISISQGISNIVN